MILEGFFEVDFVKPPLDRLSYAFPKPGLSSETQTGYLDSIGSDLRPEI